MKKQIRIKNMMKLNKFKILSNKMKKSNMQKMLSNKMQKFNKLKMLSNKMKKFKKNEILTDYLCILLIINDADLNSPSSFTPITQFTFFELGIS